MKFLDSRNFILSMLEQYEGNEFFEDYLQDMHQLYVGKQLFLLGLIDTDPLPEIF